MTASQKTGTILLLLVVAVLVIAGNGLHINAMQTEQHTATTDAFFSQQQSAGAQTAQNLMYTVVGKQTLSASFINQVLAAYGSPTSGKGQQLYDLGVKYGIDSSFALAFFQHESTFGKFGEATTTRSLGNLRCIPDAACVNTTGQPCQLQQSCYASFATWDAGFEAWYRLIRMLYVNQWHLTTVEQILPRYAPTADHNDEAAYISSVEHSIDLWREGKV